MKDGVKAVISASMAQCPSGLRCAPSAGRDTHPPIQPSALPRLAALLCLHRRRCTPLRPAPRSRGCCLQPQARAPRLPWPAPRPRAWCAAPPRHLISVGSARSSPCKDPFFIDIETTKARKVFCVASQDEVSAWLDGIKKNAQLAREGGTAHRRSFGGLSKSSGHASSTEKLDTPRKGKGLLGALLEPNGAHDESLDVMCSPSRAHVER